MLGYATGKRLEVTIFGTEYFVGMVRMNNSMVKAAMKVYGLKKWNKLINDIVLGPGGVTLAKKVGHTLGHPIEVLHLYTGITMQGKGFGMDVFWGGEFFPIDMVESKNKALQPSEVMRDYKAQDILGVFWARRESAMFFRWENVDELRQEDLIFSYDSLAALLAKKRAFDLVSDITLGGVKGRRKKSGAHGGYTSPQHVFHVKK